MDYKQRFRIRLILGGVIVVALVLVGALYNIQIIKGVDYFAQAESQYIKPNEVLFDRGDILFVSKDGLRSSAAIIERGYTIFINPKRLLHPDLAYQALSQYMNIDKDYFFRKANKKTDPYEELAQKVKEDVGKAIITLSIPGVGAIRQTWRSYPGGGLASQVLGIVGENKNGIKEGRYGLERSYEDVLKRAEEDINANIFAQFFSDLNTSIFGKKQNSGDIVISIEPTTQVYVEKIINKTQLSWKPQEIGGLIIDPNTGDIIAMASSPSFDPNDLSSVKNPLVFGNPLVEHVYEMGSIVKPLTMAVALDVGVVTPSSTYEDTGTMTLDGKTIGNFDGKARGRTSMQDILSQSLNMGAATIALSVGKERFGDYFFRLGLGEKTGIDEPNEAQSIIHNISSGKDIEIATAAFGQGIAISPIAMARALSVLANGGYLVRPRLVHKIEYKDGSEIYPQIEKRGPIFKKQSIDDVTRMMVRAVDTVLHHGQLKMEHYSIAAKTGTAQIPNNVTGGYYDDRYIHSFFGYFPAYNPRFLVFLYQINPKGANYASETLTDPFGEIAKFLIDYYDIPPDR